MRQRSHNRHHACSQEHGEHVGIHAVHVADKTIVHFATHAAVRPDDVHVGSRQAQRIDSMCLQAGHDVLIDQSGINHSDHAERLCVSDAPAAHHLRSDAEAGRHVSSRTPAAMDEHFQSRQGGKVGQQSGKC